MRFGIVVIFLLSLVGLAAWAQTKVDQGKPGNQGCWPVCVSGGITLNFDGGLSIAPGSVFFVAGLDGGAVNTNNHSLSPECTRIVQTNDAGISTTPVPVPGTPAPGRTWVRICNSLLNTSTAICGCSAMTCPASVAVGAVGDLLATGDCVTYPIGVLDGGLPCCVCNGSNVFLPATECVP